MGGEVGGNPGRWICHDFNHHYYFRRDEFTIIFIVATTVSQMTFSLLPSLLLINYHDHRL